MSAKYLFMMATALVSLASVPAHATEATAPAHTMAAAPEKTGNPDVDFAQAMIVHHQAAITMSEEYSKTGKDRLMLRMATQITNSQKAEIKTMEAWLKKNGVKKAE